MSHRYLDLFVLDCKRLEEKSHEMPPGDEKALVTKAIDDLRGLFTRAYVECSKPKSSRLSLMLDDIEKRTDSIKSQLKPFIHNKKEIT